MGYRQDKEYVEGDGILPCFLTKREVEELAEQVGKLAGFEIGDDLTYIVERLGGRISYQNIDDWVDEDGSIFVHEEGDFDITLPHYTSPLRDRFTIAHELGHYFLHSNQGEIPIIAYRKGTGRLEWEANWFAASLLMPRRDFEMALRGDSLAAVASQFGVSIDAARVRKESLGV